MLHITDTCLIKDFFRHLFFVIWNIGGVCSFNTHQLTLDEKIFICIPEIINTIIFIKKKRV